MTIRKEDSGQRSVQAEVEVPGTPEQVWQAIASGPGIGSWFVPTTFELGEDGVPVRAVANFGPGMESVSEITSWDPPRRMTADSQDLGPDAPSVGTEWIVEAQDGGTCIVRVVHSLFASTDDWDGQLEGWESGWPDFFRILRLYLEHFGGQPSSLVQLQAMTTTPREEAWPKLMAALGFQGVTAAEERRSGADAPELLAHVERVGESGHPEELLLRMQEPHPGLGHLFAMAMGGKTLLSVRFFLYGDNATSAASEHESRWGEWLAGLFPAEASA